MENRQLYHHGIKGMKWGVRRFQRKDGSLTAAGKKRAAQEEVKKMSDAELRNKINRLQMEQQYSKLTAKQVSAGKKFVKGVLIGAATGVATAYVSRYMNKGLDWVDGKAVAAVGNVVKTVAGK